MSLHNFKVMQAEASFNTTINNHTLGQIPSDWKEPRGNPYYVLQIGNTQEFVYAASRVLAYRQYAPFDPNSVGPPRLMLIGESVNAAVPDPSNPDQLMTNLNIEVYPYPDGLSDWTTAPTGEYRVRVPYWRYVPALVASGDTNWFTENATQFIVDFATARGFMIDWDENRASFWMTQAVGPKFDGADQSTLGGWAKIALQRDKSLTFAPGKVLTPRRDVYGPTDQWRT